MPDTADAELTRFLNDAMPFTKTLGVEVVRSDKEAVVVTARWAAEHCTSGGVLHGGFIMAVVDSAGAACAVQHLPEGAGTSTIESKTNFLGAVRDGVVTVTSTPVHVGRTTIVVQTDARDERGKLVTRSLQTQAVLQPR